MNNSTVNMQPKNRSLNPPFPHARAKSSEKASRICRPSGEEYECDRLIARLSYLDWMLRVFDEYEQNGNLRIIKKFVAANSRRFRSIVDELQQYKENISGKEDRDFLRGQYLSQIHELTVQNQHLDQQYLAEQQKEKQLQSTLRSNNAQESTKEQLQNLETTIVELKREIEDAERRNAKLRQQMNKCPFFQEYELMCLEIEGVAARNEKLRRVLENRRTDSKSFKLRQ